MDSIASLVLAFMGVDGEINILGKIGAETTIAFHCHFVNPSRPSDSHGITEYLSLPYSSFASDKVTDLTFLGRASSSQVPANVQVL